MTRQTVVRQSVARQTVATKRAAPKLSVCILSPHPLVLGEFERILAKADFKVISTQLESTLAPDLRSFEPPPAQVYVIDAHASKPATGALLANLMERFPEARLIVVGEQHNEANSYALLRLGVKGLLTYAEAREQLTRALPLVAIGGFWVPRPTPFRFRGLHTYRAGSPPEIRLRHQFEPPRTGSSRFPPRKSFQ